MHHPQTGILPENNTHATFLCVNVHESCAVYDFFSRALTLVNTLQKQVPEAALSVVVAIGADAWSRWFKTCPDALVPFAALDGKLASAVSTPYDLFIHVRSERRDINFEYLNQLLPPFDTHLEVVEEVEGFRYLDSRDLTGFVDGTENPEGEARAAVALLPQGTPFAQGSYLHIQRYVHNLPSWNALPVPEQEDIIARTKEDNIEYASKDKPLTAHIKRVNLKDEQGKSMEILRHSMPYGTTREKGLLFVSYANTPAHFNAMLESMILGDGESHHDHLMQYTRAVTGAAFFAPSVEFLMDATQYIQS